MLRASLLTTHLLLFCFAISGTAADAGTAAQRFADDPSAREYLKRTEDRDNLWNGFPGFLADISIYFEGKTYRGEVEVRPNRKVNLVIADEVRGWAERTLQSIVYSSTRKPFAERYQGVGIVFGKDDLSPFGQLVELSGDSYQTRFRIRDNEILVIERTTAEYRISIHMLHVERDEEDAKTRQSFVVYYYDKTDGSLQRSEAIQDEKVRVGRYVLPLRWHETEIRDGKAAYRALGLVRGTKKKKDPRRAGAAE